MYYEDEFRTLQRSGWRRFAGGACGGPVVWAGIYVRISSDRTGEGLGVSRQEADTRVLTGQKGWSVYRVYIDNDVSAYSGKPRPAWDALMADIAAGQVGAIACWHIDRLTRSLRELEEVIDLHDKRGVLLATVTGEVDLGTPPGRMMARILGAAARGESEQQAYRRRSAGMQRAASGRPHRAGNRRGYGYQPDCVTVIPGEARVIGEAATRALAGESVRSIAMDLNDRGIPSATGRQWSAEALRKILTASRISGRREHYGTPAQVQTWPEIIPVADSGRLRELLARQPGKPRPDSRRYLLSGILTCDLCGAGLYARPHRAGQARYTCLKAPGLPGCGKIAVMAEPAGERARDKILTALDSPDFVTALILATSGSDTPAADITGRLREIEDQREELARDWASRRITRAGWLTARDALTAGADALAADLARTQRSRTLAHFAALPGTVRDRRASMTTGARRALVKAAVAGIPVRPAPSRRWDPSRIGAPLWRA